MHFNEYISNTFQISAMSIKIYWLKIYWLKKWSAKSISACCCYDIEYTRRLQWASYINLWRPQWK